MACVEYTELKKMFLGTSKYKILLSGCQTGKVKIKFWPPLIGGKLLE